MNEVKNLFFSELSRFASIPISLNVKKGEKVLLLADTRAPMRVVEALAVAVHHYEGIPSMLIVPAIDIPGQEPAPPAAEAILGCDIVFACCSEPITHTQAIQKGIEAGVRYVAMGSVAEEDLTSGAATADYQAIDELTQKVVDVLASGDEAHMTSEAGTDLRMRIGGRKTFCFSGVCRTPQLSACFPDGEAAVSPVEETTNGRLVVDRSFHQIGHLGTPITLDIVDGRVHEIHGEAEAEMLKSIWSTKGDENSYHVAHISIGTNAQARVTGNTQEHKKLYAGMHVGFGDDIYLGGFHQSKTHMDGIVVTPTLVIDGKKLLGDGNFFV
jgi:leucyl aminopeptidase (aminopeptidase T)